MYINRKSIDPKSAVCKSLLNVYDTMELRKNLRSFFTKNKFYIRYISILKKIYGTKFKQ
jgi:hypothetical protein